MKKLFLCLLTIGASTNAMQEPGRDEVDRDFSFCNVSGINSEVDEHITTLARDFSRDSLVQRARAIAEPYGITLENVRVAEDGDSEARSEAKLQICNLLTARSLNGRIALDQAAAPAAAAVHNEVENNHDEDEQKEN